MRNLAARNHSLTSRGMSRRFRTFECDVASAVTKVHIRSAPMSWRLNEYVRKRKSFSDCEVPERFQLKMLARLNRSSMFENSSSRAASSNSVIVVHVEGGFSIYLSFFSSFVRCRPAEQNAVSECLQVVKHVDLMQLMGA